MNAPCHVRERRAGFSIIELVLVLVVIGIAAGIALPNINITRYQVDGAMRGVGSRLLAAQRQAVTRQHDVIVSFDMAAQAVKVHEDADNDGALSGGERVVTMPLGEKVVYGRGSAGPHTIGAGPVTFTQMVAGQPSVTFHRNGSASQAGGLYMTSRRELNTGAYPADARVVEVDRATGRTSWFHFSSSGGWVRGF